MTQPVRIGDRVTYANEEGVVEEIGLTYTFIRTLDRRRLVVPNSKLASDTDRQLVDPQPETFAEVKVPVPLAADLDAAIDALREDVAGERDADVYSAPSTGRRPWRYVRSPATSSRPSVSSTTCGCEPTGGCGRSASGREPEAQGQAEAATEAGRRLLLAARDRASPLVVLAATAAGGAVYFGSSCDLGTLRPVRQADNSLVYGANGDLIGVLPAVENRTAVVPTRSARGCRKRPSRSRTGASTTTAVSTRSGSFGRSSPT